MQKFKDVMSRNVKVISPDATIREAPETYPTGM